MFHALLALSIQLLLGFLLGRWWLGVALSAAFFGAREITQAEYRWIEAFGEGRRANMPWWGGLDPAAWTIKSVLDVALPVLATVLVAYGVQRLQRRRLRRAEEDSRR